MRGDANGVNVADGDDRAAAAEPDEIGSLRRLAAGVVVLSAAILLAEVTLSRVFAIVQFHHFAFLLVTLALLGFRSRTTNLRRALSYVQQENEG